MNTDLKLSLNISSHDDVAVFEWTDVNAEGVEQGTGFVRIVKDEEAGKITVNAYQVIKGREVPYYSGVFGLEEDVSVNNAVIYALVHRHTEAHIKINGNVDEDARQAKLKVKRDPAVRLTLEKVEQLMVYTRLLKVL